MTTALITQEETGGAVIFMDKSVKEVSHDSMERLGAMIDRGDTHMRLMDGSLIMLSSISKILTKHEYYEQYPDRRPPSYTWRNDNYGTSVMQEPWKIAKSKIAMEQMIRGFKSAFVGKQMGKEAKEMLKHMEAKLLCAN